MKKVLLSSNPYRDKNFKTLRQARQILESAGMECRVCLVFNVEQKGDLPRDIAFCDIDDSIDPEAFQALYAFLAEAVDILCCSYRKIRSGKESIVRHEEPFTLSSLLKNPC